MLLNTATSNIMIYDDNNDKISSTATTTQQKQNELTIERIVPLPSVLIDFMAMTICDLIPPRKISARRRQSLPNLSTLHSIHHNITETTMPELVYFIQKITFQAGINCRTALVALIYLNRAKQLLPRGAIGGHDTCHRMFLASILLASKFMQQDHPANSTKKTVFMSTCIPSNWSHYYSYHSTTASQYILLGGGGPLTNKKLSDICGNGLFPLSEINQLERAFLKLIQYTCWVDDKDIQDFVLKHRVDFSL